MHKYFVKSVLLEIGGSCWKSQDKLLSILHHNVVSPDVRTKRVWDCVVEFCDVFALEDEDR